MVVPVWCSHLAYSFSFQLILCVKVVARFGQMLLHFKHFYIIVETVCGVCSICHGWWFLGRDIFSSQYFYTCEAPTYLFLICASQLKLFYIILSSIGITHNFVWISSVLVIYFIVFSHINLNMRIFITLNFCPSYFLLV